MPYRQPGSPYWYISYTDSSGTRVRESSGTSSHRDAKELEAKRRSEALRIRRTGEPAKRTYDELMLAYLQATTKKRSHERDKYSAKALHKHFTGSVVQNWTPQFIADYKTDRTAAGAGDATIAKELFLVSAAIEHANLEWGWSLPNIVRGRVPNPPRGAPRWLTHEEAAALIAHAMKVPKARLHLVDFIELGLATGMRPDEMLSLEWARVDLRNRLVYFDVADQKSGIPGSIPLNNWAVDVLRRRLGARERIDPQSPWVFVNRFGDRLQALKNGFRSACQAAGLNVAGSTLKKVTPHTLRHTFASWLVQSGVPIRTVMELMRHASITTTMIYAHLGPKPGVQAVSVLDGLNPVIAAARSESERAQATEKWWTVQGLNLRPLPCESPAHAVAEEDQEVTMPKVVRLARK